ncbi:hypothetical protein BDZ90DRAFT_258850 [Jaminaea rosea]|uniref:Uncharacterized protein n=1 Tax=Jaminaea rosea TaxID=1569628 RepID=A0A316UU05_9BASI|nr:hypothetical protein BDZ90DRAFT_258850 [Jaminaea rosea]PWN28769.1 hypothetical protein BDZ90DRAFT_258850 [Jaminaea rosea]
MVPFTRFAWSIAPQLGQPHIARRSITHAVQLTLVLLVSMGIAHLLTTASMAAVIPTSAMNATTAFEGLDARGNAANCPIIAGGITSCGRHVNHTTRSDYPGDQQPHSHKTSWVDAIQASEGSLRMKVLLHPYSKACSASMRNESIELQHLPRVNAEPRPNSGSEEDHDDAGEGEGKGLAQLDASLHLAGKGRVLIETFDSQLDREKSK